MAIFLTDDTGPGALARFMDTRQASLDRNQDRGYNKQVSKGIGQSGGGGIARKALNMAFGGIRERRETEKQMDRDLAEARSNMTPGFLSGLLRRKGKQSPGSTRSVKSAGNAVPMIVYSPQKVDSSDSSELLRLSRDEQNFNDFQQEYLQRKEQKDHTRHKELVEILRDLTDTLKNGGMGGGSGGGNRSWLASIGSFVGKGLAYAAGLFGLTKVAKSVGGNPKPTSKPTKPTSSKTVDSIVKSADDTVKTKTTPSIWEKARAGASSTWNSTKKAAPGIGRTISKGLGRVAGAIMSGPALAAQVAFTPTQLGNGQLAGGQEDYVKSGFVDRVKGNASKADIMQDIDALSQQNPFGNDDSAIKRLWSEWLGFAIPKSASRSEIYEAVYQGLVSRNKKELDDYKIKLNKRFGPEMYGPRAPAFDLDAQRRNAINAGMKVDNVIHQTPANTSTDQKPGWLSQLGSWWSGNGNSQSTKGAFLYADSLRNGTQQYNAPPSTTYESAKIVLGAEKAAESLNYASVKEAEAAVAKTKAAEEELSFWQRAKANLASGFGLFGSPANASPAPTMSSIAANAGSTFVTATTPATDDYMRTVEYIESRGNTNAFNKRSQAKGLHQFLPETGADYGLVGNGFDYRADPSRSRAAFQRFTAKNQAGLSSSGFATSGANLYLAHQQGLAGAKDILGAANGSVNLSESRQRNMNSNLTPEMRAMLGGSVQNSVAARGSQATAQMFLKGWQNKYASSSAVAGSTAMDPMARVEATANTNSAPSLGPKTVARRTGSQEIAGFSKAHGNVDFSGLQASTKSAMGRLRSAFGSDLTINSAYRSPAYNSKVGGAQNSQHTHGRAIDVSTAGMDDQAKSHLLKSALSSGFSSVGFYPNFLHFDTRPSGATWGNQPAWAQSTMVSNWQSGQAPFQGQNLVNPDFGGGTGPTIPASMVPSGVNNSEGYTGTMQDLITGMNFAASQMGMPQVKLGADNTIEQASSTSADVQQRVMSNSLANLSGNSGNTRPISPMQGVRSAAPSKTDLDSIPAHIDDYGMLAAMMKSMGYNS